MTDRSHTYDDIINLPHHVSYTHPHMAISDRAAQFAPFAALTGYDNAVNERARLTEEKRVLSEDKKAEIDRELQLISSSKCSIASVTYFERDKRKSGGIYKTVVKGIKKLDAYHKCLVLDDNTHIPFDDIYELSAGS